jgi:hypothetical protein
VAGVGAALVVALIGVGFLALSARSTSSVDDPDDSMSDIAEDTSQIDQEDEVGSVDIELDLVDESPERWPSRSDPLPPTDCRNADCDGGFVFLCGDGVWSACVGRGDGSATEVIDIPDLLVGPRISPDGRYILASNMDTTRVHDRRGALVADLGQVDDVWWLGSDRLLVLRQRQLDVTTIDEQVLATHELPPGLPSDPDVYLGPWDLAFNRDRTEMLATFVPSDDQSATDLGLDIWHYSFADRRWTRFDVGDRYVTILRSSSVGFSSDGRSILTFTLSPLVDRTDPDRVGPLVYDVIAISMDSGEVTDLASVSTYRDFGAVPSPDGSLIALRGVLSIRILEVATGEVSDPVVVGRSGRYPGLSWGPSGDRLVVDVQSDREAVAVLLVEDDLTVSDPYVLPNEAFEFGLVPHWAGAE